MPNALIRGVELLEKLSIYIFYTQKNERFVRKKDKYKECKRYSMWVRENFRFREWIGCRKEQQNKPFITAKHVPLSKLKVKTFTCISVSLNSRLNARREGNETANQSELRVSATVPTRTCRLLGFFEVIPVTNSNTNATLNTARLHV